MPKPFSNKDGKTVAGPYAIAQKLSDAVIPKYAS